MPNCSTAGRERLVQLAVELRQSLRVGQAGDRAQTAMPMPIYANGSLRRLTTCLGCVIRDIGRRIDSDPELE